MRIALVNPITRRAQGYHTIGTYIPQLGLQVLADLVPDGHQVDIIDEVFGPEAADTLLTPDRYDLVDGDLMALRSKRGNFGAAGIVCGTEDGVTTSAPVAGLPSPGQATFHLVRAQRDCRNGTYDGGAPSQSTSRDPALTVCN